jgi:hypothetical protein
MLTVLYPSKYHAYIVGPDGKNLVTVNNLKHVECVKAALERFIQDEAAIANGTKQSTEEKE